MLLPVRLLHDFRITPSVSLAHVLNQHACVARKFSCQSGHMLHLLMNLAHVLPSFVAGDVPVRNIPRPHPTAAFFRVTLSIIHLLS